MELLNNTFDKPDWASQKRTKASDNGISWCHQMIPVRPDQLNFFLLRNYIKQWTMWKELKGSNLVQRHVIYWYIYGNALLERLQFLFGIIVLVHILLTAMDNKEFRHYKLKANYNQNSCFSSFSLFKHKIHKVWQIIPLFMGETLVFRR